MSLDRRTTIKWMFAAAASVPSLQAIGYTAEPFARERIECEGRGHDDDRLGGRDGRRRGG